MRRGTVLIIALSVAFGSFSVYQAVVGCRSHKVSGTLPVPSATGGRTKPSEASAVSNLGTPVLTNATAPRPAAKTELTKIEQIQVGDRVLAESPTGEEDLQFGLEIIPSDWRKLTLRAPKRDGTAADAVLLRPLTWLNEQRGKVGGTVFISVPECGIDGNAQVLAIEPCPEIPSGAGRVVTGTFRHQAASTITLTISGEPEPIGCTGNHPLWSEDRQDFVRADSLQPGETLRTSTGLTTVQSWTHDLNPTPVCNIEVHGVHVYHVGTSGVLVHNGAGLPCPRVKVIGRMADLEQFDFWDNVDTWRKSGPSQIPSEVDWAMNKQWLDERIARGDRFLLAADPLSLPPVVDGFGMPGGGYFTARELDYLTKRGISVGQWPWIQP